MKRPPPFLLRCLLAALLCAACVAHGSFPNGNTLSATLPDPFTGTARGVTDTYDFADRLIQRVAAFNGTTGTVTFAYDGDGRRVGKTVGSLKTHYYLGTEMS